MNYQKMQNNYLKNQVMSASPNKLIEMLLQAAIKNIKLAQLAIEKQELAKAHEHFIKTQNILLELRTSLDEKQGGEIAEGLAALYEYMYQQLIEANIKKEVVPAQAVAVIRKLAGHYPISLIKSTVCLLIDEKQVCIKHI